MNKPTLNELEWAKEELEDIKTYYSMYQNILKGASAIQAGSFIGSFIIALEESNYKVTNPALWFWAILFLTTAGTSKVMKEYTIWRVKELREILVEESIDINSIERRNVLLK